MAVNEIVPLLDVRSMPRSLAFYVDGLGFEVEDEWRPEGEVRWCMLRLGKARLMIQREREPPASARGLGVDLNVMCDDALVLYREFLARGVDASEPFVGNAYWVTSVTDPDGYGVTFESPTDVPEETRLSELEDA